jgi:hypothetical protein
MDKNFTGSLKTGEDDTWEYLDTYVDGSFSTKSLKMKPLPPLSLEEAQWRAHDAWKKRRPDWYVGCVCEWCQTSQTCDERGA